MSGAGGDSSDGRAKHLSPKGAQLHRSLLESLNERDRANFAQVLEYYQRTKNVQRLVESLNEICRTPQQREEIYPLLRAFMPRNDRERFDYECYRPRSAYGRRQYHTYSKYQLSKYHTTRSLPESSQPHRWNGSSGHETPPRPSSRVSEGERRRERGSSRGRERKEKGPETSKVVVLARDADNGERFGFSIRGGAEHNVGIFVSSLDEGSVAEEAGLCLGDQIIEGNGMGFNDISHTQAVEVIQQAVTLHLQVKSVGKIPGTFKSSSTYRWIDPSGNEVSPPAEYSKANVAMRETNKSEMRLLGGDDERKVHLFVADGAELGLRIRGGIEFGIGIFIASVDEDSGADRAGFQVGDQILDVNGKSFLDISHKEAVEVLKNAQHMVITLKDVGILPHGKRIHDETRWIRDDERAKMSPRSASTDTIKKKAETQKMPSFHESMGSSQLTHHSIVDHSDDILEVKARQVLPYNELQAFDFYLNEYRSTHLSLTSFLSVLSDLLQTSAKASLFQEIRSAILPRDLVKFDEWMENSENQLLQASHIAESKLTNHDKLSLYSYKSSNSSTNSWFGLFKNGKHERRKENYKNNKKDKERPNSPKEPNKTGSVGLSCLNGRRNSTSSEEFPPPPKFITDNENSSDKQSASSTHSPREPFPWFQETKNQSPVTQKSPPCPQVFERTISPSDIRFGTPGLDNSGRKSNHLGPEEDYEDDTYACVNYRGANGSSRNVPSGTTHAHTRSSKVMRNDEDTEDGSYAAVNNWDTTGSSGDPYITINPLYSTPSFEDTCGLSSTASREQARQENTMEIQMNAVRENMKNQMPLYAAVDKSKMNRPKGSKNASYEKELELPPLIPERRYTETELVTLLGKDRKPFENGDLGGNEVPTESLNKNSTELQSENSAPEVIASTAPNVSINGQNEEPCVETSIKSFPERLRQFDKRCVLDDTRNASSKERLKKSRKSRSRIVQEAREDPNQDSKTFVVELTKHTSNLGLSITGGTDTESKEIRIKSVKSENTVAGSCPLLKPGQIILGVDDKPLCNVTSGIAAMTIRQAFRSDKNVLKFVIENGSK